MAEIRTLRDGFHVGFAGDTLNTAIYCARLRGTGDEVGFYTRIGEDPLSIGLRKFIVEQGVQADLVEQDTVSQLGLYSVSTDANGERSFHYWRNTSAARNMFQQTNRDLLANLADFDIIYLSGITLAILSPRARADLLAWLQARRAEGHIKFAFDSNYRPQLWENKETAQNCIAAAWKITDIALPSVDDELTLFGDGTPGDVRARINSWGCEIGALKCGAQGPLPLGRTNCGAFITLPATRVVDTTAAGDSFNGAFLAGVARGKPLNVTLEAAHNTASRVIGFPGAIIPLSEMQIF